MSEFPTKEEFRAWLVAKEPDEVVGTPQSAHDCPLARCVRGAFPDAAVVPQDENDGISAYWRPEGAGETAPLPDWADRFARWFDRANKVTAKQALTILDDLDVA